MQQPSSHPNCAAVSNTGRANGRVTMLNWSRHETAIAEQSPVCKWRGLGQIVQPVSLPPGKVRLFAESAARIRSQSSHDLSCR